MKEQVMAIYTRFETEVGKVSAWRDGFPSGYTASPGVITFDPLGIKGVTKAFGTISALNGVLLGGTINGCSA
jgi:hypothetical protein